MSTRKEKQNNTSTEASKVNDTKTNVPHTKQASDPKIKVVVEVDEVKKDSAVISLDDIKVPEQEKLDKQVITSAIDETNDEIDALLKNLESDMTLL